MSVLMYLAFVLYPSSVVSLTSSFWTLLNFLNHKNTKSHRCTKNKMYKSATQQKL